MLCRSKSYKVQSTPETSSSRKFHWGEVGKGTSLLLLFQFGELLMELWGGVRGIEIRVPGMNAVDNDGTFF